MVASHPGSDQAHEPRSNPWGSSRLSRITIAKRVTANKAQTRAPQDAGFYENRPYSDEPIPGTRTLTKKRYFPRVLRRRPRFRLLLPFGPQRTISVGWGNIKPIPFGGSEKKHSRFAFRQTSALEGISRPFRPETPARVNGTLSSFSPKAPLSILLPPRSAPGGRAGHARPPSTPPPRPPYSRGVNPHGGSSPVAARKGPNVGASSIFRASCFGR
ncbi:hypothetical protein JTE90_002585 [Oedothorax gibbosus]|uniref:Uncharacterized protein n=1 Tax=Oedothorax gibbosus TaxID=931172 RepID=A0AAV6TF82_9ARAC|nr:hypothetical protein JTE90_002585 [Oedothorax gibbosus]